MNSELRIYSKMINATKRISSGSRSGFTLVEMLIVIIVLGILAMIIVPQIVVSSDDAKLNTLKTNLQSMRRVIGFYYHQHGAYPGVKKTDGSGADTGTHDEAATAFVDQLTKYTEASGKASEDSTTLTPPIYGPYLKTGTLPTNPFNSSNGIRCNMNKKDVSWRNATPYQQLGWKFYIHTGVLIPNDSHAHENL